MKLTTLFLLATTMLVSASVYSQSTRLTLKFSDISFEALFQEIEKKSEFRFAFSNSKLNPNAKIQINTADETLEKILDKALPPEVGYEIIDRYVVILDASEKNSLTESASIQQQQTALTGKVTDSNGQPLPGVTVVIKGTSRGTITDTDGNYVLSNIPPDATLVFSFVGMRTQEVAIGSQSMVNVAMQEDMIGIDEVIAVGYGTMKKSDLTGSVTRIHMVDKNTQANVNLLQGLIGVAAGVNVEGRGGAEGQPSFSIRGRTSLSASTNPLIVIDGIIFNGSLSALNVNDIESVDVLKDASAAAVYGSRSANGVILITTKRGVSEKPVIAFDMYYGFQDMTNNPMRVMNAEEYAIRLVDYYYQQDLYSWYRTNPTSDEGKPVRPDISDRSIVAQRLRTQEERENYLAGNEIDWVDEVLQVAPIQNYNLSVSGKSGEKVNYFVSGSFTDHEGIQINDKFQRVTLRSNIEAEIVSWLSFGLITSYSYIDNSGIPADLGPARRASPLADNYIGLSNYDIYLTGEQYMPYPLDGLYVRNSNIRNDINLTGKGIVSIPFIKGLTNEINYSQRYHNRNNNSFWSRTTVGGTATSGKAEKLPMEGRDWIVNNIVTYLKSFDNHRINTTLLFSREHRNQNSSTLEATEFDNELLGYNNMALGTIYKVNSSAWEENSISYMARANYAYKSKYMATGTIRQDGYSGFGKGNKWATFPSLSLAWVTSSEPFFADIFKNTYLKIRTSYGINGNQGIGRYSSLAQMGTDYYVYGSETAVAIYPNTLGNASLSWEKTKSFNVGLDFGFFEQRILGSLDLYKANTSDVLVRRSLPRTSGYNDVWANIGGINNKGIELEIHSVNIKKNHLNWTSDFIFSLNRDEISKLYGHDDDKDVGNSWFVGEPISAIYDLEMAGGVWTEDELYNGEILNGWYPGQFKYIDHSKDKIIDPNDDRVIIGYSTPSYRLSINNSLSYNNFSLSFFINSVQGGKNYYLADNSGVTNVHWVADRVQRQNQSAVRPYWTPDNNVNNATGVYNNPAQRSGIYQSRSFIRLQDVSLSYSLGSDVLGPLNVKNCQLFISSKNLYVWTKWEGWDPETGTSNSPLMRNLITGIRLSF